MRLQEDKPNPNPNDNNNNGGDSGGNGNGNADAYGGGNNGTGGSIAGQGRKMTVVALDGAAIRRMTAASVNVGVPMDSVAEGAEQDVQGDVRVVNAEPETRDVEKALMEEEEDEEKDKAIMPAPGVALG